MQRFTNMFSSFKVHMHVYEQTMTINDTTNLQACFVSNTKYISTTLSKPRLSRGTIGANLRIVICDTNKCASC